MDLLEMGRSIHDIGPRLRWSDVGTIVRHLDQSTSHFIRQQNPDREHLLPFLSPQMRLMAEVVDEVARLRWALTRSEGEPTPLLQRMHQQATAPQKQEPEQRRPKPKTAAEVRALVAAAIKK